MSSIEKSAGNGAASDQPVADTPSAQQQAIGHELECLQGFAREAESMSFLLRYALEGAHVFEQLRDASNGSEATRNELRRACPDWDTPDAMAGFESATAWLASELHTRACLIADSLRIVNRLAEGRQ